MINIRKNIKVIGYALMCTVMLCGCANSKEHKDDEENTKYSYEYQEQTTRKPIRQEELTTIRPIEGPTASVEPNDNIIEITTEDTISENETGSATIKPEEPTTFTDGIEESTTSSESETTITEEETDSGELETDDAENETDDSEEALYPFYMSKAEFDVEEMTYTRLHFYIKNNPGDIVWTSADDSVAQVVNDELIGICAGSTTITGTSGDTTVDITVNVAGMEPDKEERKRIFISSERMYLFMDDETLIEDDMMNVLEDILDEIEAVTGYSYTDISENVVYSDSRKKIVIKVINSEYDDVYASTDEVVLNTNNASVEQYGVNVLIHELIHVIQFRNGVDVGTALTEGYAEYFQEKVIEQLSYETTYDTHAVQLSALEQFGKITKSNIEGKLLYPEDVRPLSYFFVKYIVETYGDEKLKELVDVIAERAVEIYGEVIAGQSSLFTQEEILTMIEANTTEDLMTDFFAYFSELSVNNG